MADPPPLLTTVSRASVPPLVLTNIKVKVEPCRDDDITRRPVMNHHHQLTTQTLLPVLTARQKDGSSQSSSATSLTENSIIRKPQAPVKPHFKKPLRPILPKKDVPLENKTDPHEKKRRSRNSKPDNLLCQICSETAR